MSPWIYRRILPVLALMAALALPHPVQAAPVRTLPRGTAVLSDLPEALWSWTVRLWSGIVQKNGAQTDPNGSKSDNGAQTDPYGLTASRNGEQLDLTRSGRLDCDFLDITDRPETDFLAELTRSGRWDCDFLRESGLRW
jgi:hypothetical protein